MNEDFHSVALRENHSLAVRISNFSVFQKLCKYVGKPIISTPVGIAPDIIHPETGVLVEKNDIEGLCNAMAHMLDHAQEYDSSLIRRYADAYSYEVVGKHLKHAYKKSLGL